VTWKRVYKNLPPKSNPFLPKTFLKMTHSTFNSLYTLLNCLGKGTDGEFYSVRNRITNDICGVKVVRKRGHNPNYRESLNEAQFLMSLRHVSRFYSKVCIFQIN